MKLRVLLIERVQLLVQRGVLLGQWVQLLMQRGVLLSEWVQLLMQRGVLRVTEPVNNFETRWPIIYSTTPPQPAVKNQAWAC